MIKQAILTAESVLYTNELEQTLDFFTNTLGFQLKSIYPADNPKIVRLDGYQSRIRLVLKAGPPGELFLTYSGDIDSKDLDELSLAPNGTKIHWQAEQSDVYLPELKSQLEINQYAPDSSWQKGRAGMEYRDLLPSRWGGRFIASHIKVVEGGPISDYVHFHQIKFQMIYCYKGWATLVYQDQGKPFKFSAGDCVLQPPEIRHRVLECSPGFEVVELCCPAEHLTHTDHKMDLPTAEFLPEKLFNKQKFIHHKNNTKNWSDWRIDGFKVVDTDIAEATQNIAGARLVKREGKIKLKSFKHQLEFLFIFILTGDVTFLLEGKGETKLSAADSIAIPKNVKYSIIASSVDCEFLEVSLPGGYYAMVC